MIVCFLFFDERELILINMMCILYIIVQKYKNTVLYLYIYKCITYVTIINL